MFSAHTLFAQSFAESIKKEGKNKKGSNELSQDDCLTGNFRSFHKMRKNPDTVYTYDAEQFINQGFVFGDDERECRRNAIKAAIDLVMGDYSERYSIFVIEKIKDEAADYVILANDYGNNIEFGETTQRMRTKYKTNKRFYLSFEKILINYEALFILFESVGNLMQNGVIMISKRPDKFPTPEANEFADKAIDEFIQMYTNDKYKLTVKTQYLDTCPPIKENSTPEERRKWKDCITRNSEYNPDIFYTISDIRYDYNPDSLKAKATISVEGFNTKTQNYISAQTFTGKGYADKGNSEPVTTAKRKAVEDAMRSNEERIFDQFCGQMYNYILSGSDIIINLPAESDDTLLKGLVEKMSKDNGYIRPQSLKPNSPRVENNQTNKVWLTAKLVITNSCGMAQFLTYLNNTVNSIKQGYTIKNDGNVFDVVKM